MHSRLRRHLLLVAILAVPLPEVRASVRTPQTPPLELVVVDAKKEIDAVEAQAAKLRPGDKALGAQLMKRLDIAGRKLKSARDQTRSEWAELAKRHGELQRRIVDTANAAPAAPAVDPKALAALTTDADAAYRELGALPADAFGDDAVLRSWRERIAALKSRHGAFPADDRKVANVGATIDALTATVDARVQARESGARSKSAEAELASLVEAYQEKQLPAALSEPLSPDATRDFAASHRALLTERLPKDLATIEEIGKQPDAPRQRLESARHWIGFDAKRRLEERLARGEELVRGRLEMAGRAADFVLAIDAKNASDVANKLLGEGRFDENMARLQEGLVATTVADALDEGLGREKQSETAKLRARLTAAVEHLRVSAVAALDQVRMPPARSTDAKLLATAAETLKNPQYGVPAWERLVINADLRRQERWESAVDRSGTRATITTYHFVWDEFQVATAEKVGDETWIYFNRLRFFHSGGSTTPTGRWILAERFQSTRILPDNIAK